MRVNTARAGDAAHPSGKWLQVLVVWEVVALLPQGLVSQILQKRGPIESHGQLTRVKVFLEVLLMHNLQSPITLASCWSLLHC